MFDCDFKDDKTFDSLKTAPFKCLIHELFFGIFGSVLFTTTYLSYRYIILLFLHIYDHNHSRHNSTDI